MLTAIVLVFVGAIGTGQSPYKQSGKDVPPDIYIPLRYAPPLGEMGRLEVTVGASTIAQAGRIDMDLAVRNASQEPFACHCDFDRQSVTLSYALRGEEPTLLQTTDTEPQGLGIRSLYMLKTGEAAGGRIGFRFDYGKGRAIFDRPGAYDVRVIFDDDRGRRPGGRLVSDLIEVTVVTPAVDEARDALQAFSPDLQRFADGLGGGEHAEKVFRAAVSFVERFGETTYGADVRRPLLSFLKAKAYEEGLEGHIRPGAEEYAELHRRIRKLSVPVGRD